MAHVSPTDRRILEHLRNGLHDAEIAVRIGQPVFTVKERIRALERENGLEGREALLTWYEKGGRSEGRRGGRPVAMSRRRWLVAGGIVAAVATTVFFLIPAPADDPAAPAGPMRRPVDVQTLVAGTFPSPTPTITPTPTLVPIATPLSTSHGINNSRNLYLEFRAGDRTLWRYLRPPGSPVPTTGPQVIWEVPIIEGERPIVLTDSIGSLLAVAYHTRLAPFPTFHLVFGTTDGRFDAPIELDPNATPRFLADGRVALATNLQSPDGWRLLSRDGTLTDLVAPDAATGGAVGAIPGRGVLWLADGGLVVDETGAEVFRLEHDGRTPDRIEAFQYQGNLNLDISAVPAEEVPDYFVPEGLVLVTWRTEGRVLVSQISLATGEAMFTYEGDFRPVGNVMFGYAGNWCRDGDCLQAQLNHGGGFSRNTGAGASVAASAPAAFAVVEEGENCAPVHDSPGSEAILDCVPPGRVLSTVLRTEDWFVWYTVFTIDPEGGRWVRMLLSETVAGWIREDAVSVGQGTRGLGLN
jgi:hypothetical protein